MDRDTGTLWGGAVGADSSLDEPFSNVQLDDADVDADGSARRRRITKEAPQMAPSTVTVGRYNAWVIHDANRALGEEMRADEARLQARRDASTAAYHEARRSRTSVGRGQQELTAMAVREYHGRLAKSAEQGRAEIHHLKAIAERQKKEWAAHGSRNAVLLGREQRKRVAEARAERFQNRRNAALQTKQETAQRKAASRAAVTLNLEDQKSRMERVRQNTPDAATLSEAREFFAQQKRAAAEQVRTSVRSWDSDRKRDDRDNLKRAAANRELAVATREHAKINRNFVKASRQQVAQAMRAAVQTMEGERREMISASRSNADDLHRELYVRKFVQPDAAARVEGSEYGLLYRRLRLPGAQGSTANEGHVPSPADEHEYMAGPSAAHAVEAGGGEVHGTGACGRACGSALPAAWPSVPHSSNSRSQQPDGSGSDAATSSMASLTVHDPSPNVAPLVQALPDDASLHEA